MTTILIADDEASIRTILSKAMEKKGLDVVRAKTGEEALLYLQSRPIDVAIVDIRMPGVNGLDILNNSDQFPSKPAIFIITAQDTMENAIEAMKRGAYDYLTKPFDLEELSILIDRALENRELKSEVKRLKEERIHSSGLSPNIIGKTKEIQEIYKTIGRVANQDVAVLIEGESGTGKELIAKAIHYRGKRASYSFVAVNCTAIPGSLLESELFGSKKGAYTGATQDKMGYFEKAHLGTIFLDEIGDMPLELQAKLLRVLQEKEIQRLGDTKTISVDVRVLSATNQNLAVKVKEGKFREDLYFRLNVVPIYVLPLRERKQDISILAEYFIKKSAEEFSTKATGLSKDAILYLEGLEWPGNIRELENIILRAAILTQRPILEARDLKDLSKGVDFCNHQSSFDASSLEAYVEENICFFLEKKSSTLKDLYYQFVSYIERPLIRQILKKTRGNQIKAAEILGINRNTLRKKIRELKIDRRGLVEE